ncbi:hypothetical protein GCM10007276_00900 [Agaricicola taiwanensis]|uniref:Uncharacterized protein n=1 Tax=Agaricicola taiwanensis TaxID=591372 RepID=A0A8J2VL18_9RHOB|nr:hypothetical protein [Agaricicola taiwanensis]GGE27553.1 hypothetical protein GCM10007276_00900 [Agaricicola taiwanensis]
MATSARTGDEAGKVSLRDALRKARAETAERSAVIVDLRGAEIARLDLLKSRIEPLLEDLPKQVEMFDLGIVRGDPARLFIDMVAFVELAHDRRSFRFVQDTRYGRVVLADTGDMDEAVEAVTDYIGRRLVERERALAADTLTISSVAANQNSAAAKAAARVDRSARGLGAAVFAAFALGAVAGSAGILAFGWFWINGTTFIP